MFAVESKHIFWSIHCFYAKLTKKFPLPSTIKQYSWDLKLWVAFKKKKKKTSNRITSKLVELVIF